MGVYSVTGDPQYDAYLQQQALARQQQQTPQAAQSAQSAGGGGLGGIATNFAIKKLLGSGAGAGAVDAGTGAGVASGAGAGATDAASIGGASVPGAAGVGSFALPAAGGAAALYGGYQLAKNWGHSSPGEGAKNGAIAGAGIGTMIAPGVGTLIGAGVGGAAGVGLGFIHSGRNVDHDNRSNFRDQLASGGFALRTPSLGGTLAAPVQNKTGTFVPLADGSYYDISDEHSGQAHQLLNEGKEWAQQARGWAMPMAALLTQGGDKKLFADTSAQLANAMRSNTGDIEGIRANALSIFERLGMNQEAATGAIQQLAQTGKLTPQEASAYVNGINTLFTGKGYVTNAQLQQSMQGQGQPAPQPTVAPQITGAAPNIAQRINQAHGVNLR